jgi:prepilin-type N-terminal cleavage/methylation domain-containing protein
MSSLKNSTGFSLFELCIVIVIIGIMALFARPSIRPFIENIRLRSAVNTTKQHLIVAKTRALGDPNVHAGVFFNATSVPYSVVAFLDDNPDTVNDNLYTQGKDHILCPSYSLSKSDTLKLISGTNPVVFRGDGSAKASAKFFVYSLVNGKLFGDTISVLASTGRIKISRNF